jgi:hypothetical protein
MDGYTGIESVLRMKQAGQTVKKKQYTNQVLPITFIAKFRINAVVLTFRFYEALKLNQPDSFYLAEPANRRSISGGSTAV